MRWVAAVLLVVLVGCSGSDDAATTTTEPAGIKGCVAAVDQDEAVDVCESLSDFTGARMAVTGETDMVGQIGEAAESAKGRCERVAGADWEDYSPLCRDVAAWFAEP